jgi:hypothetical protein
VLRVIVVLLWAPLLIFTVTCWLIWLPLYGVARAIRNHPRVPKEGV